MECDSKGYTPFSFILIAAKITANLEMRQKHVFFVAKFAT